MIWRWFLRLLRIQQFGLVVILILGSSAAFLYWLFGRPVKKAYNESSAIHAEDFAQKLPDIDEKWGRLVLADNDLYDLDNGVMIRKEWLKEGMPQKLFFDKKTKKFLAQYERGFVRYETHGAVETMLVQKHKPALADDYNSLLYSRDRDIWQAGIDWKELKLVNERKVTAIEQFNDVYFSENIFLSSEKALIVRNMNKVLRVDLESGDVKQVALSLNEIRKRRTPDGKRFVGVQAGQFFCYDVDINDAQLITLGGRAAINDYQWLDNDRCLAIVAMNTLFLYDRPKNTLTKLVALPSSCFKVGEPSPDGRFAFCVGKAGGILVDTTKKTAVTVAGGAGMCWLSNETFAFSREVPDSDLRGTWLQTAGEGERRVSNHPYLVEKLGPMVMLLKSAGLVVFATTHGLSSMKPDGTEVTDRVKLPRPPLHALGIEEWER